MLSRDTDSQELLQSYFRIYFQALQQQFGNTGNIFSNWEGWFTQN